MRKLLLIIVLLAISLGAVSQVDQYKVRARLFLQTDSFLIWRGDTIDFDQLVSLQQLIDSLNNYANQHLSSTKGGNNVDVNITGGDGTMFSVADGDSVATNELQTISISNDTIYLSNTGGNVKLPAGADNWGTQVVVPAADSLLRGKGTTASPLYADTAKIATQYDISLLGNVTKVGTPANDQVGVWTGNGTIEGDADLTFDGNKLKAKQFYISSPTAGDSDYDKFLVLDATGTEVKTRTGSQLLSDIGAQASLTTGNLTESVTGLQFSATRQVIGGAAALSLTSGYVIPTTTEQTNWGTAYTHASSGDADVSATNEIQNLSKSKAGNNVTVNISGGTGTTFSVADADSSVTNEIQTISISNDTIYLSKSGGNVKLPSGADNWGTQVVVPAADSLLRGKGTTASPLYADTAKLATQYDISLLGNVTKVGTPANDQVGVWTGNGTIEGDADLTFDGNKLTAKQLYITTPTAGGGDYDKFLVLDATGTEVKTRTGSQVLSDIGAQSSLTTGNLTESVTGLQFSATRQVIGGAAALSLTSGYVIPTTTEQTNWGTAYTHASSGDADVSATNEIQNLSKSKAGNNVTVNISGGTGTTFSVADADSSVTNEIQTISISNDTIYLSKSGGNVKLPSGADNWGTQVVVPAADSLLRGKGTTASPLYADTAKLATQYDLTVSGSKWTDNGSDLVPTGSERINVTVNQSGQNVANFSNTHASGLGLSIVAADTVNSAFSVADYQGNNRFTITGDGDIYASSLDYENTADQVVTYNSTTDKLSYYDYAPNPFTPDTYGLTYSGGNIGLGIASQANNGLYVRDSTGSYNYAAIIENKHAGGGGLRVNVAGYTNLYYPLRLYGNSAEVFGVSADGSITVKETSGTIPNSGYGAIYAKTDSKLYYRSDGGTEYDLTLGEGGEGSTSPGGSSGDIQYNNGGSFGGFGDWNGSTLTVPGELAISSSFTTTSAQPVGISSSGYISLYNISAPSAPSSTTGRLYMDSGDDKLYFKNSANTYDLTAATSGSGWVDNGTTVDLSTSSDNVGIGETGSSSWKCTITATGSQGGLVASTSSSGYDAIYARNYSTSDLNNALAGYFITDGTGLAIALQAQVNSGGGSGSCAINATNSSTSASTVYGGYFSCTSGANGIGVRSAGSAYDFYAAGGGTDYGSSSSIRWKTNIMVIPDALKKVNKLRGVYFDWDKQHGGGHSVGFIAEEVGKVLPEIVQYEKNGVDATGMDYSKITPLLLQAIKELSDKVDKLEKEVNKLKRYMPY